MSSVECQLAKVVMSETHERQIIVLQEKNGERRFPVVIGPVEVFAIHRTINKEKLARPLTHELVGNILGALGVAIERVIVNDLRDQTFYARILLRRDGKTYDVDSRPSDAIALALQVNAPIYVEEKVLREASGSGPA